MISKTLRTFLGFLLFINLLSSATAEIILELEPPPNTAQKEIHERLQSSESLKTAVNFLNDTFIIKTDIKLRFGDYDNIWYQDNVIEFPYLFINDIRNDFKRSNFLYKKGTIDGYTGNVLLHIIFHEFAHAIIDQYDIPVIGREEDAADGLADVLLLFFFDQGSEVVASVATSFYIRSKQQRRFYREDYWSDHSLDKQRYYTRLCHIYGSNPKTQQDIKKQAKFDDNKADRCEFTYYHMERSWLRLLQPALINKIDIE